MAVFLFATAISGMIGTLVVGEVIDGLEITEQRDIGYVIAINTGVPCIFAALMFYITSFHYERQMKAQNTEKEVALEKASVFSFDGRKESAKSYGVYKFNASSKKY